MFSHLHINEDSDHGHDMAIEFKISRFFNFESMEKYGQNLENFGFDDLIKEWDLVCAILGQSFNRLFYLNSFSCILCLYKVVLDNFDKLILEKYDFTKIVDKKQAESMTKTNASTF